MGDCLTGQCDNERSVSDIYMNNARCLYSIEYYSASACLHFLSIPKVFLQALLYDAKLWEGHERSSYIKDGDILLIPHCLYLCQLSTINFIEDELSDVKLNLF